MSTGQVYKLEKLAAITSTGSVLPPSTFEYVYRALGSVLLGSITGGTDILSLFGRHFLVSKSKYCLLTDTFAGAPSLLLPVHKGEIQCKGLGMAVEVWSQAGKYVEHLGEPGDLVCVKAFPCMPVMFWNDPEGAKYKASYFEHFEGRCDIFFSLSAAMVTKKLRP